MEVEPSMDKSKLSSNTRMKSYLEILDSKYNKSLHAK